eukprot:5596942-Amphidinium_carterae.1
MHELNSFELAEDGGWGWAQEHIDAAADLRSDLAKLGLIAEPSVGGCKVFAPITDLCLDDPMSFRMHTGHRVAKRRQALAWSLQQMPCGDTWSLSESGALTIGRKPSCDVVVRTAAVSGRHCVVSAVEGGVIVQDLGGHNGTYLNGRRLGAHERSSLQDGDRISLTAQGPSFQLSAAEPKLRQFETRCIVPGALTAAVCKTALKRQAAELKLHERVECQLEAPEGVHPGKPEKREVAEVRTVKRRRLTRKQRVCEEGEASHVAPQSGDATDEKIALMLAEHLARPLQAALFELHTGRRHLLPSDGLLSVGRRADCEV